MPLSSVSSTLPQRSASHGMNVSRTHFDFSRCSCGVVTSPKQSIGPPGMPSNTMISHSPVVVSAGKTKYSPTVGMRLNATAEYSGRGVIPVTYVSASARMGLSYGERSASRSKRRTISPLPAATSTRSFSCVYRSRSSTPTS